MQIIKYQLMTEINHGTEDTPEMEQTFSAVAMSYSAENEAIAKREAYNGEYTVEDDGEPEPETPANDDSVWDALDAAYQEGVNTAYDQ